jgi:hypothetical protein
MWDISPNGKRFLLMKDPEPAGGTEAAASKSPGAVPQPKINIVVNWFEELKERVPAH